MYEPRKTWLVAFYKPGPLQGVGKCLNVKKISKMRKMLY